MKGHDFGPNDICRTCGCSRDGVRAFGFSCKDKPPAEARGKHDFAEDICICGGTGTVSCTPCAGKGNKILKSMSNSIVVGPCPECGGTGRARCNACGGTKIGRTAPARERKMKFRSLEEAVFEAKSLADPVEYVMESGNPDELFGDRHGGRIGLIHFMVMSQSREGVELLLDIGADLELRTSRGATPLMVAVTTQNHDLIELLLEKGADPNVRNEDGDALLHVALSNDLEHTAQLLLDHGADLDSRNALGISARQIMLHAQIRLRIPSDTEGLDGVLRECEKKGSDEDLVRLLEFCKASLGTKVQQGMSRVKARAIERKIEAFLQTHAKPATTAVEQKGKHRRMLQIIQEVQAALTEDIS